MNLLGLCCDKLAGNRPTPQSNTRCPVEIPDPGRHIGWRDSENRNPSGSRIAQRATRSRCRWRAHASLLQTEASFVPAASPSFAWWNLHSSVCKSLEGEEARREPGGWGLAFSEIQAKSFRRNGSGTGGMQACTAIWMANFTEAQQRSGSDAAVAHVEWNVRHEGADKSSSAHAFGCCFRPEAGAIVQVTTNKDPSLHALAASVNYLSNLNQRESRVCGRRDHGSSHPHTLLYKALWCNVHSSQTVCSHAQKRERMMATAHASAGEDAGAGSLLKFDCI